MIIEETFYIALSGDDFDPLPLVRALEGDPTLTLDYHLRSEPHPRRPDRLLTHSYLIIEPHEERGADLPAFLRTLLPFRDLILDEAADWRVIYITISFEDQHNWELGIEQLRIIVDLNLSLAVSWYEAEQDSLETAFDVLK